ncbi:MAG: SbcC/MukB-like Walker B domain-containing protein [Actinomycetota bacterium]|nr:SbcC/MukB-like Walker B domain-containing protein [Actinomycetota bacterium]MDA8274072.1 SbcC/MukB-like Walker B domain-containing protein [Actinomycetota bacterium]MDA8279368.1 SbcC/MukB-like Walker B domain-containing protein [Actinomycetota bacterium]
MPDDAVLGGGRAGRDELARGATCIDPSADGIPDPRLALPIVDKPWNRSGKDEPGIERRGASSFGVQVADCDWDGSQAAIQRPLQRLSTGERSMDLHLAMIASVAARPVAFPRLILLDDLFTGVDTANRARHFGTFTASLRCRAGHALREPGSARLRLRDALASIGASAPSRPLTCPASPVATRGSDGPPVTCGP